MVENEAYQDFFFHKDYINSLSSLSTEKIYTFTYLIFKGFESRVEFL